MVSIDADGRALATYVESTRVVKLRTSDALHSWTPGLNLLGQSNGDLLSEPRVAAMVTPERPAYTWVDLGGRVVLGFLIDGEPVRPRTFESGMAPRLAVDPRGGALLAWAQGSPGVSYVEINEFGGTTGTLTLAGSEGADTHAVAVAIGGGTRVLAWLEEGLSLMVSADTGAGFEAPLPVGGGSGYVSRPSVATNASGEALVAWVDGGQVQVATYTPGRGWLGVEVLEASEAFAFLPRVALADSWRATVVWERRTDTGTELRVSDRDTDGEWGDPFTLSPSAGDGMVDKLDLAVDSSGAAHVIFLRAGADADGDRPSEVLAACRHPERGWGEPVRLDEGGELVSPRTSVGGTPAIAAGGGRVVAVWAQNGEIRVNERQ